MSKVLIGIDPDVTKSGVCIYNSKDNFQLKNLRFFELFKLLKFYTLVQEMELEIYIEAGWLNKSNWHKVVNGSSNINAQIGQRTGANHETGKKIVEMCEYLGLNYHLIKPTKTKVDAITFNKITNYKGRTNQEQRDAAMLIFGRI
jgi:hypothetical protein